MEEAKVRTSSPTFPSSTVPRKLFTHHSDQVVDVPHILVVLWTQLDVSLRCRREGEVRKSENMTSRRRRTGKEEEEVEAHRSVLLDLFLDELHGELDEVK